MERHAREQLEARVNLADHIGRIVYLEGEGPQLTGDCPFHQGAGGTFTINQEEQQFSCTHCHEHGGLLDFVRAYRNVNLEEAFDLIRTLWRIQVPLSEKKEALEPLYQANAEAAELYQTHLLAQKGPDSPLKYLKRRGLSDASIIRYKLGLAPNSWDQTLTTLRNKGFSPEIQEQAGLVISRPEKEIKYYDRFRDRIMFPLFDISGRVIGFSGRILENSPSSIKYMNSPETPIFNKGSYLYGLHFASKDIKDLGQARVVEGYTDVILAHQAQDFNTVAMCGSGGFSEEHLKLAHRRFPQTSWTFCFDGDEAGQESALRTASRLLGKINGSIATLPEGKDPADLYQIGGNLNPYCDQAQPLFDYYFEKKKPQLRTLESLLPFLETLRADFREIPAHVAGLYHAELAKRLELPFEVVREALKVEDPAKHRKNGTTERGFWEENFVRQLVATGPKPELVHYFADVLNVQEDTFYTPEVSTIYGYYVGKRRSIDELHLSGTVLFGIDSLLEYAQEKKVPVKREKILDLLETRHLHRQKPSLADIEHSLLMVCAHKLPRRIDLLHQSGSPFTELYAQIQTLSHDSEKT